MKTSSRIASKAVLFQEVVAQGTHPPSRLSLTIAGLLMLGIVLGRHIEIEIHVGLYGVSTLLAGLVWIAASVYGRGMILGLMLTPILAGMTLITLAQESPPPQFEDVSDFAIKGQVVMAEEMTKSRQRIRLRPEASIAPNHDADYRLITSVSAPRLNPGDVIEGLARLQKPLPQLLPDGFDFTAHAHRRSYVATGFVKDVQVIGSESPSPTSWLRHKVQERIHHVLDADAASVASAVLIGLRASVTPDLREAFRASGLAHLLAISGLHMALFWGSVVAAIRVGLALFPNFSSRYSSLKLATLAALPFGLFYLVLSGMPVSAVRAFLMLAMIMVAILMTRRGMTLHHVAIVAMAILLVDPATLFLPAFQMSFAAVFALVAGWMAITQSALSRRQFPPLLRYFGGIMLGSILASVASAPFVLHHFGVTTLWSMLANIAGMPLMGGVVMPFGALALLLMPIGLDALPLTIMSWGIDALIGVSQFFASLPLARLAVSPPSGLVLTLFTASMLLLVIGRGSALRPVFGFASVAVLLSGVAVWLLTPQPMAAMTSLHGRVVAAIVSDSGEAYFSRKSLDPFTRNILGRPLGVAEGEYIGKVDCPDCGRGWTKIDAMGGIRVAVVWRWRRHALDDACGKVDLVLSMTSIRSPCSAVLIDKDDIEEFGGALIYADDGVITIKHVRPKQGR